MYYGSHCFFHGALHFFIEIVIAICFQESSHLFTKDYFQQTTPSGRNKNYIIITTTIEVETSLCSYTKTYLVYLNMIWNFAGILIVIHSNSKYICNPDRTFIKNGFSPSVPRRSSNDFSPSRVQQQYWFLAVPRPAAVIYPCSASSSSHFLLSLVQQQWFLAVPRLAAVISRRQVPAAIV